MHDIHIRITDEFGLVDKSYHISVDNQIMEPLYPHLNQDENLIKHLQKGIEDTFYRMKLNG